MLIKVSPWSSVTPRLLSCTENLMFEPATATPVPPANFFTWAREPTSKTSDFSGLSSIPMATNQSLTAIVQDSKLAILFASEPDFTAVYVAYRPHTNGIECQT